MICVHCGSCSLWSVFTVVCVHCGSCLLWFVITVVRVHCGLCSLWSVFAVVCVHCGLCVLGLVSFCDYLHRSTLQLEQLVLVLVCMDGPSL